MKSWSRPFKWGAIVLVLVAAGCGRQETRTESTGTEVSTTERTEYEGTAERRLADIGARVDSLRARLDTASDEARAEMQTEIDELEVQRQNAARKLDDLRAASADQWNNLRNEMAAALEDLDQRFDRLRARLSEGTQG